MYQKLIAWLICAAGIFSFLPVYSQIQSCPVNINFSNNDISLWSAQTGLVGSGIKAYPAPNNGVSTIPEFTISTPGIKVNTTGGTDPFGGFPIIPTVNGYSYNYSVKIGSTATSFDLNSPSSNPGGFTRSITYIINVPAGSPLVPYTMTYAYAMVLENGTHNSNEQPLFKATLSVGGDVIFCASPHYYLPTFNDANSGNGSGSTGATLDSAAAIANGFTNSPLEFLSHAGTTNAGQYLRDVWTKGWTEVTFDLSPYRGQQVTLTFEADNCVPGAHFAYAYVALRNSCAGLEISGPPIACANTPTEYSVPALAGATYHWTVPVGWTVNSGDTSSIINVTPGLTSGFMAVEEKNSCADLRDTVSVSTKPPTVAGRTLSDNTVCAASNTTTLNLNGSVGNVLNWLSSTDGGANWSSVSDTTTAYTAQNLLTTTQYRALVQNGSSCSIDSSEVATIIVDPKSVGGILTPASTNVCAGQTSNTNFSLTGSIGSIINWQRSNDNTNWIDFSPVKNDSTYSVNGITADIQYRVVTKSGVCPADTSSVAAVNFINVPFPSAITDPDSANICFGKTIPLNATINIGTNYIWSHAGSLSGEGNGVVSSIPFDIHAIGSPTQTTDYVLTINNTGCPNPLQDTFHVVVSPPIIVFAGNDTAVVANQPLQLNATVNDPTANQFNWSPATGLNFTTVPNPVAIFSAEQVGGSVTYIVRATNTGGCYGEDTITVKLFKTGPDIFVPSGFTPNGDGRNDILKPICVGIKQLNFFRVYNRWGQLVYSTSSIGIGWDGNLSGQPQSTGNFVYIAQGVDYTGKVIFKKGNVMLIR
ncbi:MAG TPA: gliding motility-associated C-terminal domain-containing protein [Chitinophagaceae bacterium]